MRRADIFDANAEYKRLRKGMRFTVLRLPDADLHQATGAFTIYVAHCDRSKEAAVAGLKQTARRLATILAQAIVEHRRGAR